MKRRTMEDYRQEIKKALTNPERLTCDYWHKPVNMRTSEQIKYFYLYHRIPSDKTIQILREMLEENQKSDDGNVCAKV